MGLYQCSKTCCLRAEQLLLVCVIESAMNEGPWCDMSPLCQVLTLLTR